MCSLFVFWVFFKEFIQQIYAPDKCACVQNVVCKAQIITVKIVVHANFNSGTRCYPVAPQTHINIFQ